MEKSSFECKKVLISLLQTVELESSCMTWIVQEFGDNFEPNFEPEVPQRSLEPHLKTSHPVKQFELTN